MAGIYSELAQTTSIDCGDQYHFDFRGGGASTQVSQTGSKLDIPQFGPTGVLHQDGSAVFGPIAATAQPEDSSSPPVPGKMRLEGWFVQQGGRMTFEGSYTFVADPDGCELDAPTRMTR